MKLLLSHISYLLAEHRVIPVVGLGTFVRTEHGASFKNDGLNAPKSSIEFYSEIDPHADRILEASIARALNLPRHEASALIDDEVLTLTKTLYSGTNVEIEGVGVLSYVGNSIKFEPSAVAGWSALGWYNPLTVEPLIQEEPERPVVTTKEREAFMKSLSRTASSAAAVAVLILITFITSQLPGRRYGAEPTQATFGVETTAIAPAEALIPRPAATSQPVLLVIKTPSDGIIEATPKQAIFEDTDPYVLVVASLANNDEVEKYMAAHVGENLGLVTTSGRYRVFAATGNSIASLKESATESGLYDKYPNAWICRR